ncbi:hypothetical protein OSB04_003395 [Centaurea solstitialis]|uniref:K-box domain-containing protein n=1 Tax=Centaurea solstitialis TaxID=347529 RepID=A0AA38WVN1_9ASTR|nr:hypothetical protein OSB04_003302 [Centaurea solstitialis]KAJ9567429.1 hypothetical protein OSB04_003395 [Centaurea solstitialis]
MIPCFSNRMERILERYERYSYAEMQLTSTHNESQGSWTLEHAKLKARIEILQKTQRHLMGEDLDSLSLKELQNLEQQLDMALKHIRLKKNQVMTESISQLQKKAKELLDQNNLLSKQIKEMEKEIGEHDLEHQSHDMMASCQLGICDAYHGGQVGGADGEVEQNPRQVQGQGQASTSGMPAWMIQHMNK